MQEDNRRVLAGLGLPEQAAASCQEHQVAAGTLAGLSPLCLWLEQGRHPGPQTRIGGAGEHV